MPHLEDGRVRAIIESLRPDSELKIGRRFFLLLYQARGAEGVLNFVRKGMEALDAQVELDLHYNFDAVERECFRKAKVPMLSRRSVLSFIPASYFAGEAMASGGLGVADRAVELMTGEPNPGLKKAKRWVDDHLGASAELAIGVAVADEVYEGRQHMKKEQIADAIAEIAEATGLQSTQQELQAQVKLLAQALCAIDRNLHRETNRVV